MPYIYFELLYVWCICPVEKENLVLGHIYTYVCTSSRQIGTEAWDKRQANRQAKYTSIHRISVPASLGTCFDWGSSCTQTLRLQSYSFTFSEAPFGRSIRNTHQHSHVLYNSCRIVTNQFMYELLTSPSVVNGTVITHSCIPDFTIIASVHSCAHLFVHMSKYIPVSIINQMLSSILACLYTWVSGLPFLSSLLLEL